MSADGVSAIRVEFTPDVLERIDVVIGARGEPASSREEAVRDMVVAALTLIESTGMPRRPCSGTAGPGAASASPTQPAIYAGGCRPIGFDVGEEGRLVPNPAEQQILITMREMRARGAGYREIARAVGRQPMTVKRILDKANMAVQP